MVHNKLHCRCNSVIFDAVALELEAKKMGGESPWAPSVSSLSPATSLAFASSQPNCEGETHWCTKVQWVHNAALCGLIYAPEHVTQGSFLVFWGESHSLLYNPRNIMVLRILIGHFPFARLLGSPPAWGQIALYDTRATGACGEMWKCV